MESSEQGFATIDAAFAKAVRVARKAAGLSQDAVTEAMNARGFSLATTAISKIENDDRKVTISEASALADVLSVSLDSLLGGQASLQSAYAASGRERGLFQNQMQAYTLALLEVAVAADSSAQLTDRDIKWLSSAMLEQTPAGMTRDALVAYDAAISYHKLPGDGHYVNLLRARIARDMDVLKSDLDENDG